MSLGSLFLDSGINLSDNYVIILDQISEFFVLWSHGLAVSAPGSEELHHDVLVRRYGFIEVLVSEILDVGGGYYGDKIEKEKTCGDLHGRYLNSL